MISQFMINHHFFSVKNSMEGFNMREPIYDKELLKKRGLITNGFSLPYNPNLVAIAAELRINMTPAEKKLWTKLFKSFPVKVIRQRPIDNYIVDFYCAKLNLVVEIDGSIHNSPEAQAYDQERTEILQYYGLKVMRFSNTEVEENFEGVCRIIENQLKS
jgi:very-short-patch-repair endonuclease